jgi:hypothetical protein
LAADRRVWLILEYTEVWLPPPEPTEPPSRLSMFAHDVSNWVDHIITDADHTNTDADRISTDPDHTNSL